MSRLLTIAGGWWKPVAALALAAVLATWADAAPPTAAGTTKPTTATTGGTTTAAAGTSPAAGGTTTAADGPIAEIVALAQTIADQFDLTFEDPLDEMYFFFAVADLYFQMQRQQHRAMTRAAGGRTNAATSTTGKPTLGSLTAVNK